MTPCCCCSRWFWTLWNTRRSAEWWLVLAPGAGVCGGCGERLARSKKATAKGSSRRMDFEWRRRKRTTAVKALGQQQSTCTLTHMLCPYLSHHPHRLQLIICTILQAFTEVALATVYTRYSVPGDDVGVVGGVEVGVVALAMLHDPLPRGEELVAVGESADKYRCSGSLNCQVERGE